MWMMELDARKPPRRREDRIILQFDYDCFYAQVFENRNPGLKSRPLGVRQKSLLATCNYHARARGVRKLMPVSEARRICPDLVLVDGEDLTPFRDTSKLLFNFLRSHSWNGRAERLGFDEVFLDVTDLVDYSLSCLNRASLGTSFFHLSGRDPELGFPCDLTSIAGCTAGRPAEAVGGEDPAYLRLCLGSHLARYLRGKLEEEFGYTSTCGISTSKLLSKLVGSRNKPRNQTTLLAVAEEDVLDFMDPHNLRSIPGLGSKMTHVLESHITGAKDSPVTVAQARLHPTLSPAFLESLLGGPGAERGIGARIWGLLHGVDPSPVKEAGDVPSQISIEDTYPGGVETLPRITEELHRLSCSLVRRMRVDLVAADDDGAPRWIACPRTLRLSIRLWPGASSRIQSYSRTSRSGPMPSFAMDLRTDAGEIARRLVGEALVLLLRRMWSEGGVQMINICAANVGVGDGRDIAAMFQRQDEVLRPWKVVDHVDDVGGGEEEHGHGISNDGEEEEEETLEEGEGDEDCELEESDETSWTTEDSVCATCGRAMPSFAMAAHARYHELGD